ncbi:MAG TPA: DUF2017 family protein [Acidimicrobiales bacterium]|nr:DUF2017 family protein [Acidimicrobiales bacterium]
MLGRQRWRLRAAHGGFDVNLPAEERELLRELPGHVESALGEVAAGEPVPEHLRRLFPVANPRDEQAETRFVETTRAPLLAHHRAALAVLAESADARHLTHEEGELWLAALNTLRLVLGSSLGVSEDSGEPDPEDPRYADWICYHYLSYLASEMIDLLSASLPPPIPGADDELPDDPWGEPLGGLRWDGTPLPEQP